MQPTSLFQAKTSSNSASLPSEQIGHHPVSQMRQQVRPLTLPCPDGNGNTMQLWKSTKYGWVGSVVDQLGKLIIIPGDKIINPLDSSCTGEMLLERLENFNLRRWSIVYDEVRVTLTVWPHLMAAGNGKGYYPHLPEELPRNNDGPVRSKKHNHPPGTAKKDYLPDRRAQGRPHIVYAEKWSERGRHYYLTGAVFGKGNELLGVIDRSSHGFETDHPNVPHWHEATSPSGTKHKGIAPRPPKEYEFNFTWHTIRMLMQRLGLGKSYNSSNPGNPIATGGSTRGQIGGVACSSEYITGLFDKPESLFETSHSFFIPAINGEYAEIGNDDLHQILRELAIGIYLHDTVPFFSLHFTKDNDQYPVVHPAYENTLVGQVISFLDYFMKGYVNGGVFLEEFVQRWQPGNYNVRDYVGHLINLRDYCQEHLKGRDQFYLSENLAFRMLAKDDPNERAILKDFSKFNDSYRIIAKQRGFEKSEGMFTIQSDFDVFYTTEPDPVYQETLDSYVAFTGQLPPSFAAREQAKRAMQERVHNHMTKLPFCKRYFALLGVISFFSHYFQTLKKHGKMPILPTAHLQKASVPPLFPALPILDKREETIEFSISTMFDELLSQENREKVIDYLFSAGDEQRAIRNQLDVIWKKEILNSIKNQASFSVQLLIEMKGDGFLEESPEGRQIREQFIQLLEVAMLTPLKSLKEKHPTLLKDGMRLILEEYCQNLRSNELKESLYLVDQMLTFPHEEGAGGIKANSRAVGGCGLSMSKKALTSSQMAAAVMESQWREIGETPKGELIQLNSGDGPTPFKGVAFSLDFCDIPSALRESKELLEMLLLAGDNEETALPIAGPSGSGGANPLDLRHPKKSSPRYCKLSNAIRSGSEEAKGYFLNKLENASSEDLHHPDGSTLLHLAAAVSDPFFLTKLLEKGLSPYQPNAFGDLPIHHAAFSGRIEQLNQLWRVAPSTLDTRNHHGETSLSAAVLHNQEAAVAFLLSNGAQLEMQVNSGYTPLHIATHQGNEGMVRLLVNSCLDGDKKSRMINAITREQISPLLLTIERGDVLLADFLISHGANPIQKAIKGETALDFAFASKNADMVEFILRRTPVTSARKFLQIAIEKESLSINHLLLTHRKGIYFAHRSASGDTPLLTAIKKANLPLAEQIIQLPEGAELIPIANRLGETAIAMALKGGFYDLSARLLAQGAKISDVDLVRLLLVSGYRKESEVINEKIAHIHFTNEVYDKLVIVGIKARQFESLKQILNPTPEHYDRLTFPNGERVDHLFARVDALFLFKRRYFHHKDSLMPLGSGKTLPFIAGESGSWAILEFLMAKMKKRGVPLTGHYQDKHLFYSVLKRGELRGVELFLRFAADPTILEQPLDSSGTRPVHLAAKIGSVPILNYLHEQKVDFSCKDASGATAFDYAQRGGESLALEFIQEHYPQYVNEDCQVQGQELSEDSLFLSIAAKKFDKVKSHLKEKGGVNRRGLKGITPLLLAIAEGSLSIVRLLLENGASVNLNGGENHNISPLEVALKLKSDEIALFLLFEGVNLQRISQDPMVMKLAGRHPAVLRFFAERGVDLKKSDQRGWQLIHYAAEQDKVRSLEVLKSFGVSLESPVSDEMAATPLSIASCFGSTKAIKWLLAHQVNTGLDASAINSLALGIFNQQKAGEVMNLLKEYSAFDALTTLLPAVQLAIKEDAPKALMALFEHGFSVKTEINPLKYTPLHLACRLGAAECTGFLLALMADPFMVAADGMSPLELSAQNSNPRQFDLMLNEILPEVNKRNLTGKTLLHLAAEVGNVEHAALLLDRFADLNIQDAEGKTALFIAAERGHESLVKLLMVAGADPRITTLFNALTPVDGAATLAIQEIIRSCQLYKEIEGLLPLHMAIRVDDLLAFHVFVRRADLNKRASMKRTPLHEAVSKGNPFYARELLKHGADLLTEDEEGLTPLRMAESLYPATSPIVHLLQTAIQKNPQ